MVHKIGQRYLKEKAIWEIVRTEMIPLCGDRWCGACAKHKHYHIICVQQLPSSSFWVGANGVCKGEDLQYYYEYLEGQDKPE